MAKRILIYTNHFFPENFKVNEIAQLLSEEGNYVHVVTGIPNYPSGNIYEGYGFFKKSYEKKSDFLKIRRLPLIPRGSGSKIRLILNYFSYFFSTLFYTVYLILFKRRYDVVFVHHTSPVLIAISPIFYNWFKRSKMILWDLDMWPDTLVAMGIIKSQKIAQLLERFMKWIYSNYDHILIGSEGFYKKALSRVIQRKIQYFPNWAESLFVSNWIDNEANGFNFSQSFNISYAGNIGEAQDFKSILRAMIRLKSYDINWILIGDGRYKAKLQADVLQEGLAEKVHFLGNHPIEKMPLFFLNSDAMFLSLKDEEIFKMTVPAKLQAYMASGRPIVAMISGEGAKIITESNCGYVVNSGYHEEFADSILKLYSKSKSEREQLGKNGRDYYFKKFDFENRKKQLFKILN